jgi:hypothetical protein
LGFRSEKEKEVDRMILAAKQLGKLTGEYGMTPIVIQKTPPYTHRNSSNDGKRDYTRLNHEVDDLPPPSQSVKSKRHSHRIMK